MMRAKLAGKDPYKASIGSMRLKLKEVEQDDSEFQIIGAKEL